jgi:hypothetical protein
MILAALFVSLVCVALYGLFDMRVNEVEHSVDELLTKDIVYATGGGSAGHHKVSLEGYGVAVPGCSISCKMTTLIGPTGPPGIGYNGAYTTIPVTNSSGNGVDTFGTFTYTSASSTLHVPNIAASGSVATAYNVLDNGYGNLQVAGSTTLQSLTTNGAASVNSLSVTANAAIGGAFSATGATTLSTLTTSGAAALKSASVTTTLAVTGATTVTTLTASGATSVNSVTVTNAASVGGTLAVTGATSLTTVSTSGAAALNSLSVTNNAAVSGTLSAVGATSLSTVSTSGLASLNSLGVSGNTALIGTLAVTGATTLSTVSISGAATFNSIAVTNSAAVGGATTLSSTLTVTNNVTANNYMNVAKDITYRNNINLTSTIIQLQQRVTGIVSVLEFGCVGDGVTDNAACLNAWFNALVASTNGIGYIPPGNYIVKSTLYWDISKSYGTTIQGAGVRSTWLTFQLPAGTTNALVFITNQVGVSYYWSFRDIGVTSAATMTTVALGRNNTFLYPDYIYNFEMNHVAIVNTLSTAGSTQAALSINGLYASKLHVYSNCSSTSAGTGIRYNNGASNLVTGAVYSAYYGIYLTDPTYGIIQSSNFLDFDIELVTVSLNIDNGAASRNNFHGGFWVSASGSAVVMASAGSGNMLQNIYFQPGSSSIYSGIVGLRTIMSGGCTAPTGFAYAGAGTTLPGTNVAITNPLPCTALVWVYGAGWLQNVKVGTFTMTNPGNTYGGLFTVQAGEAITITYTTGKTGMQYRWTWPS